MKRILKLFTFFLLLNFISFSRLPMKTDIGETEGTVFIELKSEEKTFEISGSGKISKQKFKQEINYYIVNENSGFTLKILDGVLLPNDSSELFYQPNHLQNMKVDIYDTINTSNVTNMSFMFAEAKYANPNVSGWDTSNVTNMSHMFFNSKLANPDVSRWNTSSVTDMSFMFSDAKGASPNVGSWNTEKVTNMSYLFKGIKSEIDVSGWNTSNVTDMSFMFTETRTTPDVSRWNTSKVTNMNYMFYNTTGRPNVSSWDTSKVTNMGSMFELAYLANPDVSNWDTSSVTNMCRMFRNATIATPNVSEWNTSKVTDMSYMFANARDANPDVTNWDTSSLINMNYMFNNAYSAKPNIKKWNLSNVKFMQSAFSHMNAQGSDLSSLRNVPNIRSYSDLIYAEDRAINLIIPGTFFKSTSNEETLDNINRVNISLIPLPAEYGLKISKIKDGVEKNISLAYQKHGPLTKKYIDENFSNESEMFDNDADYRIERHILAQRKNEIMSIYVGRDIADENGMLKETYIENFIYNLKDLPKNVKFRVKKNIDTSVVTYNPKDKTDENSIRKAEIEVIFPHENGDLTQTLIAKFVVKPDILIIDENKRPDYWKTRILFKSLDKGTMFIPAYVNEKGEDIPSTNSNRLYTDVFIDYKGKKFYDIYNYLKKLGFELNVKDEENNKFVYWEDENKNEVIGITDEANSTILKRQDSIMILSAVYLSMNKNDVNPVMEGNEFSQKVFDITPGPDKINSIKIEVEGLKGLKIDKDGTLSGTPVVENWLENEKEKAFEITVTAAAGTENETTLSKKIMLKVTRKKENVVLKALPVYLTVGDKTPEAYNYIENVKENIRNQIIKAKLVKDEKTGKLVPDENDHTYITWKEGEIDTKKSGEFLYTINVTLKSGDILEVPTKVYVYDTKLLKGILDNFVYDDTDIVNRFDEKYFGKIHLGALLPVVDDLVNKGDFKPQKLIGGIEAGASFKPIKDNEDLKLIGFFEYDNKLVNHVMLGLGVKYKYVKGFVRYRASVLEKGKSNNNKTVFMNNLDIYADLYNEFKPLDNFYVTPSVGIYLSTGSGKLTKDFMGYDVITKFDTDVKLEYRHDNLSVYVTPKLDLAYKGFMYKHLETNRMIKEKPDGYLNYEIKVGVDNKFEKNIGFGSSIKYRGELTNFSDKKYRNIIDFEIHASYLW